MGLIVTLQGLTSFFFGFERHIDIQRSYVGEPAYIFDSAVRSTLYVFFTNYLVFFPIYLFTLAFSASISGSALILCLVIAVAEQLMNFSYQLALVNSRYIKFLYVASAKNITFFILLLLLWTQQSLSLETVLTAWSSTAVIFTIVMVALWVSMIKACKLKKKVYTYMLRDQYKASLAHFFIGFVAILVLQLDRLIVGLVLPLETVGIYFRHVLVISLVYQVFNIASYNRILPDIFRLAKTEPLAILRKEVAREYYYILAFLLVAIVFISLLSLFQSGDIFVRFGISPLLMMLLLLASGVRVRADLNALLFYALYRENTVLKMQIFILLLSCCLLSGLSFYFGLFGAVAAVCLASLGYLGISFLNVNRLSSSRPNN